MRRHVAVIGWEYVVMVVAVTWCGGEGTVTPAVSTAQGLVRGLLSVSGVRRYYGIPYAQADRFQPPRDPQKWKGTFNAINRFGSCAQTVSILTLGTEDCLHLDVYSPNWVKPGDKLPVLVYIHGGAYYYGSRFHYDPEYLVTKDVIVVIVSYRVGVLGFLCIAGVANLGLKDQVAALKWIQMNISSFGGDPDNVTLSGQSAGASAVGMHLLSKMSKRLFHKAILMSGNPFAPWAFNVENFNPALGDARKLDDSIKSSTDMFNAFANASLRDLLGATRDTSIYSRYFKYTPCVEENNTHTSPFFHDTPYNIIKSGKFNKVPVMMGYTEVEGLLFYGLHSDTTLREWDENFMEWLPSVFSSCSKNEKRSIATKIKSYYFGNNTISKATTRGIVDYYSDWIAAASVDAFSDLLMEYSDQPVYRYMFAYDGSRNYAKFVFGRGKAPRGPTHSDDVFYVFRPAGLPLPLSRADQLFIDRFTTMITNFMKFGEPTPRRNALLPVRWEAAPCWLRLARRLATLCEPTSALTGAPFLLAQLCAHGRPGYVPCDVSPTTCPNSTEPPTTASLLS